MNVKNIFLIIFLAALVVAVWVLFYTPSYDSTPEEIVIEEQS
ncbi:MAG: hypothetical protein AAGG81_09150 [Chlamydiota bacterium]